MLCQISFYYAFLIFIFHTMNSAEMASGKEHVFPICGQFDSSITRL